MSWVYKDNSGFTLMEILLAISIFAAVVSMAYGSYNTTFRIVNSVTSQARLYEKSRVVMGLIVNDLLLLYQGDGGFLLGVEESFDGKKADSLTFTSTGHIRFDRDDIATGYALISYQAMVSDNEEDGLSLYRNDKMLLPGNEDREAESVGLKVCDGISEISFQYFDNAGDNIATWDSDEVGAQRSKFPLMVQITLGFTSSEDPEADIVFKTGVALLGSEVAKGKQ